MSVTLIVTCDGLDVEDLRDLTRELVQAIADETDLEPGLGGLPPGHVLLARLPSEAAATLVDVLSAHGEHRAGMRARFRGRDGVDIELELDDLDPNHADETVALLASAAGADD
jgi:hypothetical protein